MHLPTLVVKKALSQDPTPKKWLLLGHLGLFAFQSWNLHVLVSIPGFWFEHARRRTIMEGPVIY
jgi:hypothetical protein